MSAFVQHVLLGVLKTFNNQCHDENASNESDLTCLYLVVRCYYCFDGKI